MASQSDGIYEIDIGICNFFWSMTREHLDNQAAQPLRDDGVAIRGKEEPVLPVVRMQPNPGLAAFYQILVHFVLILDKRQFLPQLDDVFVFVHPILTEDLKIGDDLVLLFTDRHVHK